MTIETFKKQIQDAKKLRNVEKLYGALIKIRKVMPDHEWQKQFNPSSKTCYDMKKKKQTWSDPITDEKEITFRRTGIYHDSDSILDGLKLVVIEEYLDKNDKTVEDANKAKVINWSVALDNDLEYALFDRAIYVVEK
ncbi:MAG: hypothetical protein WC781_05545 [Candidatus Pacearchaeota archaeon]|jgi:hypothetical protein